MHAGVAQACPLHGTAADASSDATGDALHWTIEQNKQLLLSLKAENRELKQVRLQQFARHRATPVRHVSASAAQHPSDTANQ